MTIRSILPQDNIRIQSIIQDSILEHDASKEGTAYSDAATMAMYERYQLPRSAYFVVIDEVWRVLGGAGISKLDHYSGNYAELQKMYFDPKIRGLGLGSKLMELCLQTAKSYAFSHVYIETMGNMLAAQKLYRKYGFETLERPLGNTGHYSCPVQMLKAIDR
ncbi:MAG: GNAT family N-acetyltransferase [Nonlabens sp.]